jgi:hypothetical protein
MDRRVILVGRVAGNVIVASLEPCRLRIDTFQNDGRARLCGKDGTSLIFYCNVPSTASFTPYFFRNSQKRNLVCRVYQLGLTFGATSGFRVRYMLKIWIQRQDRTMYREMYDKAIEGYAQ